MILSFRWFGENDKVTLDQIKQIPGVTGIVTAIYEIPPGQVWPLDMILDLKRTVEEKGLKIEVIESVPVHEDIKLGLPNRDKYIENYKTTLRNLAQAGITTVCYNFMPVFDWTRSELEAPLLDGSNSLAYTNEVVLKMDPLKGELNLPGWDTSYEKEELKKIIELYHKTSEDDLWENLRYFLTNIIKVAEEVGIKMAIHPDDPPWSIFGLPRIITGKENLIRFHKLVESPNNGIAFCTGSLGANPTNDLVDIIRYFGERNLIHFAHLRNIKITGERSFQETAHLSETGSIDMVQILKTLHEVGFKGALRPDHGRMIWGEEGRPGYGLYDRALGAVYLNGIWETLQKS